MKSALEFFLSYPEGAALVLMAGATLAWEIWDFRIRPLFISKAEIERMANELVANHGERAEEVAFIKEDSAWRHADSYQQGVWLRVRKELRRQFRLGSG